MPELKIHLPDELDKRFRKAAMTVHGYGRGSISKAAIEALAKWCTDHEPSPQGQGESTLKEERIAPESPKKEKTRESSESKQVEASSPVEPDPSTSGTSVPTA